MTMPPAEKPAARKAPTRKPAAGPNEAAVAKCLAGFAAPDVALAQLAITLAKSLDSDAGSMTHAVAKELRATLAEIREGAATTDDDFDAFLTSVSTPVRHSKN